MKSETVNIAFCFDENVLLRSGVAITSLLYNSKECRYNICCVVNKGFSEFGRQMLRSMVEKRDPTSTIIFIEANSDFDRSFVWKSTAVYYRLMLPCLLPDLDEIIYADTDVVFCDNLAGINRINLGSDLIGGVKDIINVSSVWRRQKGDFFRKLTPGKYLNSGFLLMNLKELRDRNLYAEWVKLSEDYCGEYPDQDILNYTCEGRKTLLPLKYNFIPQMYMKALREEVYSSEEYAEAFSAPVMIHYAGAAKRLSEEEPFLYYAKAAGI
ncbi:MAG: glycosyltransferase family 8 protein [Holosporaceae bacterium]|nr:glycosyltransferase family 8 protein [Holosporaceae bacterium]